MIGTEPETITFDAGDGDAGQRLDQLVATIIPGCSRNAACRLIQNGDVRVNHTVKKPGYRLAAGDIVTAVASAPEPLPAFTPQPIDLDVIYKDPAVIGINKPPAMVVHPAAGHFSGTLAQGLAYHFPELENVGHEPNRPGIVHRLDKDTSGVLIAARTREAFLHITRQFKDRTVEKSYLAFIHGNPDPDEGSIMLPIYRHPVHRKKMAADLENTGLGRHAETRWRILARYGKISMVQCDIKTGRTHQIRVHLAAIGHPVVGDPVYGYKHPSRLYADQTELACSIRQVPRQMLHARQISLNHPQTGRMLTITAPLPDDMESFRISIADVS
ncbi:MAG: RluA family pseudouridine synthase [Desulfobacterales bacterium]|nr:RluA family pseudouridine synthase [Desulfobacterales bacterium]